MTKVQKSNDIGVIIAYIAVCILWGSTYLAMRIAVKEFPPELFAGMRFLIAGGIVLLYSVISKKAFPKTFKDVLRASVPGIIMLMGSNGLVMWAEQWVNSGITSLLVSATPLFVVIIESIFFREVKMKLFGWVCIIIGFAGTALLIMAGAGLGSLNISGGLIVLASALLWAIGSIYAKRVKVAGHISTQIGLQMISAGIGLTSVGFAIGEASNAHMTMNVGLSLAYLIVFGSIIGYSSNLYVLKKWPASVAITSAYINPVVAVILGVVLLNEKMNLQMLMFMIITLGSVVLLHLWRFGYFKKKASLSIGRSCAETSQKVTIED